ncbi:unnamed protein product, partial [Mesorhabditis belari]|uniref:Checkpoint protein n=1 Tax=Mesorhabditis belari TaxID=2138241 RepID=A0AAF3EZW1_9BILA
MEVINSIGVELSRIASKRITVLVTNHVVDEIDEESENSWLKAALPSWWAHRITSRLWVERVSTESSARRLALTKSPFRAPGGATFIVEDQGIRSLSSADCNMKLTLELGDRSSLESFARICSGIVRLSKGALPVRVTPEGLYFLVSDICGDCGTWLCYGFPEHEFTRFVIDGYNEEQNEIMFTVAAEAFARSISSTVDERCVIKLAKRNQSPHLSINLFGPRSSMNHLLSVAIVLPESTRIYKRPNVDIEVMLSATLPSTKLLYKLFNSLKNLSIKSANFKITTAGELHILGTSDKAELKMFFEGLPVSGSQYENRDEVASAAVRLPIKCLHAIWTNFFHGTYSNVVLKIEPNRFAVIYAEIDQNRLELIVPGLVENAEH